jgi:hypothetical protein
MTDDDKHHDEPMTPMDRQSATALAIRLKVEEEEYPPTHLETKKGMVNQTTQINIENISNSHLLKSIMDAESFGDEWESVQ